MDIAGPAATPPKPAMDCCRRTKLFIIHVFTISIVVQMNNVAIYNEQCCSISLEVGAELDE